MPSLPPLKLPLALPGRSCNSHELDFGRHAGPPPYDVRHAAVLVLLAELDGQWQIPLIVRVADASTHAGQVGFPGGRIERGETAEAAAVREASEELGVNPTDIELLGRLSAVYIYASNHQMIPCLAVARRTPDFRPNPDEVASVFWLPVEAIFETSRRGRHTITRWGALFETPHLEWQGRQIWGATRIVLDELASVWQVESKAN